MKLVTVISTSIDSLGRRLVKMLGFGKSDVQEKLQAGPFGIDSHPVKDTLAIYAPTAQLGKEVIIGYLNKNAVAGLGETRLFSTDSAGAEVFGLYLKNDGTCEIGGNADFAVRYNALETAFNQLKQDFNNHITAYNTHVHSGVTTGPGSSGTTVPGTQSNADITPAKIAEIKVP